MYQQPENKGKLRLSRKWLWNKHRTTARKGWHLAAFLSNKTVGSKIRFVGKIKPKNPRKVGGSQAWSVKKTPNVDACAEKPINSKFSTWTTFPTLQILLPNPPPLLQISVDFVLRQEVQKPFLYFLHQSSEFYLRLQSSCFFRTIFHFKLIKFVEKVRHQIENFLSFFGKNEFGALILNVFEKNLFFGVLKNKKTVVTSFFCCIFNRQDIS